MTAGTPFPELAQALRKAADEMQKKVQGASMPVARDRTLELLVAWRLQHPNCKVRVWRLEGDPDQAPIVVESRCELCKETDQLIDNLRP